eukprot:snap_masked-scaffold_11-processed-gene-12.57-mRNA-1 protein AED:1.00 eAED:1.00 QI:0/0/0/0/1/1/2/0/67
MIPKKKYRKKLTACMVNCVFSNMYLAQTILAVFNLALLFNIGKSFNHILEGCIQNSQYWGKIEDSCP